MGNSESRPGNEGSKSRQEALVECGCCYSDQSLERMAQCLDGHLFCQVCVQKYVEDVVFGAVRAERGLPCMLAGGSCTASISRTELQRMLPPEMLARYDHRQAEDNLQRAQLPGLTKCHVCELMVELDDGVRVLTCPNCGLLTCTLCSEQAHLPLRCDEVETRAQSGARQNIEERMTSKMVRECSSCKTKIVKEGGCNKMTCRCGAWTCYICRKGIPKNVGYGHYCQHDVKPGTKCRHCKRCILWEETREVEEAELRRFQEESVRAAVAKDASLANRPIGPGPPVKC